MEMEWRLLVDKLTKAKEESRESFGTMVFSNCSTDGEKPITAVLPNVSAGSRVSGGS